MAVGYDVGGLCLTLGIAFLPRRRNAALEQVSWFGRMRIPCSCLDTATVIPGPGNSLLSGKPDKVTFQTYFCQVYQVGKGK